MGTHRPSAPALGLPDLLSHEQLPAVAFQVLEDTIARLPTNLRGSYLARLAANPSLPETHQRRFVRDRRSTLAAAAASTVTDPDLLDDLAASGEARVLAALAANPATRAGTLAALTTHHLVPVWSAAFANLTTPDAAVEERLTVMDDATLEAAPANAARFTGDIRSGKAVQREVRYVSFVSFAWRDAAALRLAGLSCAAARAAAATNPGALRGHGLEAAMMRGLKVGRVAITSNPAFDIDESKLSANARDQRTLVRHFLAGQRPEQAVLAASDAKRAAAALIGADVLDRALSATCTPARTFGELKLMLDRSGNARRSGSGLALPEPSADVVATYLRRLLDAESKHRPQVRSILNEAALMSGVRADAVRRALGTRLTYWTDPTVAAVITRIGDDERAWRTFVALMEDWNGTATELAETSLLL
jgi:hypothetical protein